MPDAGRAASRPPISSRWRTLGAVVCALALVAGCSGDSDEPAEATTSTIPPARTVLRVGVGAWPECLNPLTCLTDDVLAEQILRHVLPVAMQVEPDGTYAPSALLAGAPALGGGEADEPFTVTYRIDEDARWNDGRPITSSDFRATWQAVMATPGADQTGYAEIVAVDDADPAVAVVSLAAPYADWPELFGGSDGWVLQGDALASDLDLTGRFRSDLPFSAGPYRLAAWDRDIAVLAADDEYWDEDQRPEIDQVRIERRDSGEGLDGFDIVVPDDADDAPDGFESVAVQTTEVIGVWFDRRSPLLQPKPHRDALAVGFDREEVAALIAGDDPRVVTCLGWAPEIGPWCDSSDLPTGLFDPDLGRFALAVEGFAAGEDGILARGGEPFAVTVTHDPDLDGADRVAEELSERFTDLGLAVSVGEIDHASWLDARAADRSVGVGVFAFDVGVSPLVIDLYGCVDGESSSVIAWCPPEVTALATGMAEIVDRDALLATANQIGDAAAGDLTWIPLTMRPRAMWARTQLVAIPSGQAPGAGPLAGLHDFALTDR